MTTPFPTAWLVLAFGDERQYAGNAGYEDVLTSHYRFDDFVPNHTQVAEGDVMVLRAPANLIGFARIQRLGTEASVKERLRCPECQTTAIKTRQQKRPLYRCDRGHEFDEPSRESVPITMFTAFFGDTFIAAPGAIPIPELRAACPNWNGQLAMQRIELARLAASLEHIPGFRSRVLEQAGAPTLEPAEGDEEQSVPYQPTDEDTRERSFRQIRQRRGQAGFRRALLARYEGRCVVSGCALTDVLEAAHINPFRGDNDHHPDNGLLLRADLHTLFDLDLMGINPQTLEVSFHPRVASEGYSQYEGQRIQVSEAVPSSVALATRWVEFRRKFGN